MIRFSALLFNRRTCQQRIETALLSSIAAHQKPPMPSLEEVNEEVKRTRKWLRKVGQVDGSKRLDLSSNSLPVPIPTHTVEPGLMVIDANVRPREAIGNVVNKWLRRMNRVPACLCSLPKKEGTSHAHDESINLHLDRQDAERIVREYGRNGCLARIIHLRIIEAKSSGPQKVSLASVRVKPQSVAMNAATLKLEHISFIFCPRNRKVKVDVPIRLMNVDSSVAIKKGGWHMIVERTIKMICKGDSIPPFLELDVKNMELDHKLQLSDIQIPEGTRLASQDLSATVVKCGNEVGDEVKRYGRLTR